jgi:hypothetical protein
VHTRPFPDKSLRGTRINFAFEQLTIEIEDSILAVIFRMKVRRTMIPIKHANNDIKEYTDRRHNKTSTGEQVPEWFKSTQEDSGFNLPLETQRSYLLVYFSTMGVASI